MRTIRASEIGSFLFCQRSWWYRKQGVTPENQAELAGGTAYHRVHGGMVFRAWLLQTAGWVLLVIAILLLAVALTLAWLG